MPNKHSWFFYRFPYKYLPLREKAFLVINYAVVFLVIKRLLEMVGSIINSNWNSFHPIGIADWILLIAVFESLTALRHSGYKRVPPEEMDEKLWHLREEADRWKMIFNLKSGAILWVLYIVIVIAVIYFLYSVK